MVYSTSVGFRVVFAVIAVFLIVSVRQLNVVVGIFLALSVFGALYLERWIFDKDANLFEKNVGILFLHTRKRLPLDRLQRVVLREVGPAHHERPRMVRAISRAAAIFSVVDCDGKSYGLDMVKGTSLQEIRKSAAKLAGFCGIPFEDQGPLPEGEEPLSPDQDQEQDQEESIPPTDPPVPPDAPAPPDARVTPDASATPDTPAAPDARATPDTPAPAAPDAPATPNKPAAPDAPRSPAPKDDPR